MKDIWYVARRICAVIVGTVLFVAGSLKLMDPVGAGLVVSEYFKFFHLGFLMPLSKALGVFLALLESATGAALITGTWRKTVAWAAMVLTAFFTVVTFAILIGNPDMDCGCFGEAFHLTHVQTFVKNLILCGLCAAAFFPFKSIGEPRGRKYLAFALVMAAVLALTVYSLASIPLVDFTPYKTGVELQSSLDNPAEVSDGWVSAFIYEKNGQEGSFTIDRLPDSTWTYVRTETYRRNGPSFDDGPVTLDVTDADGDYQEESLSEGEVLAVSLPDPSSLDKKGWEKVSGAVSDAVSAGFKAFVLVSSSPEEFTRLAAEAGAGDLSGEALFADHKTLLSLNRSNGGAVWLSDGMIVKKFSRNDLPSAGYLSKQSRKDPMNVMMNNMTRGRLRFQAYLLYSFAILFFL